MGIIVGLLTLAFVFVGAGFAVHVLWVVAFAFFVLWLAGLVTTGVAGKSRS
jgi:hypothetical protein